MGDELPDFHTFREMCEHLRAGGAAHRYGRHYPIYYGKPFGLELIQTRFDGGSSGECVKPGAEFTADEQGSINWVFISREHMEAWDQQQAAFYQKQMQERQERKLAAEKAKQQAKVAQSFWRRWFHRK